MFIYKLEHYQQALLAHDWNYHEHLSQARKHPDRERLLICRFEAGQQQRIALLHATTYFDKYQELFNAAEAASKQGAST
jgi:hypothetical protein